jgi:Ca2+-binding RTX toxin-like protein
LGGGNDFFADYYANTFEAFDFRGGNDVIFGELGEDKIYAGPGNDYASGGLNNDYIQGGEQEKTVSSETMGMIIWGEMREMISWTAGPATTASAFTITRVSGTPFWLFCGRTV